MSSSKIKHTKYDKQAQLDLELSDWESNIHNDIDSLCMIVIKGLFLLVFFIVMSGLVDIIS